LISPCPQATESEKTDATRRKRERREKMSGKEKIRKGSWRRR
jgi:hypothetical protein